MHRQFCVFLCLASVSAPAFASGAEVVVCNRAGGNFSIIDADSDVVTGTYELPAADNTSEPMYAVYNEEHNLLLIGDRGNDRVVAYDPSNFEDAVAEIEVGEGVFHMWAMPWGDQLWVNNDGDDTVSVIDLDSLTVIATVAVPADLVADGGSPHDVVVDWYEQFAYVSILGTSGDDWIVQYDTATFTEQDRVQVNGDDPHVSYNYWWDEIYAPTQGANEVATFDAVSLSPVDNIAVDNAHGADTVGYGSYFLTTNIGDAGTDAINLIRTWDNKVIATEDSPLETPHNLVMVFADYRYKIYVTQSGGAADQVTVYNVTWRGIEYDSTVTTDLNPFGITHIPAFP